MTGWKSDMVELAQQAFRRLRTRLVGLTDDEFLWEPVPGAWRAADWQDGVWPAPLTTLAWRLTHVINNLNDSRYATHLGLTPRGTPPSAPPETAADALDRLDRGWSVMRSYLDDLDDTTLLTPLGPTAGPWAEDDRGSFVLHMIDELIHHGAEIALLRDLFRARQHPNPAIEALLTAESIDVAALDADDVVRARRDHADLLLRATALGRTSAITILADLGFPTALPDGNSALHHAAGTGNREAADILLALGGDPTLRDPLYRATPAEWADYFGHSDLASHLRPTSTQIAE